MKINLFTKTVFLTIAVFLGIIAFKPTATPDTAVAALLLFLQKKNAGRAYGA